MVKEPESMDDLIYFTSRGLGKAGHAKAWVYKENCPKCKKAKMGKPIDGKGHVKIRAKEYTCPSCGYTVEKQAYEDTLTCEVKYTCGKCGKSQEAAVPFKRKKVKLYDEEGGKETTADSVRFPCGNCKANVDIVKKMKA